MFVLQNILAGECVDDLIYTGLDVCYNENVATCVQ